MHELRGFFTADLRATRKGFKKLFSTSKASAEGIELVEKFILPFAREFLGRAMGLDDLLKAFFATEERVFFHLRAIREFELPASIFVAGRKTTKDYKKIKVKKSQVMLAALDLKESTVRLELVHNEVEKNFLLERYEFEAIKDLLEVIDGPSSSAGLGDNRIKSVEGQNTYRRHLRRRKLQSPDDGVQD